MLVLTRRVGEQLIIADDIVVTILSIDGNKVRVGVTAPRSVRVDREEVRRRRVAEGFLEADSMELVETGSPVGLPNG